MKIHVLAVVIRRQHQRCPVRVLIESDAVGMRYADGTHVSFRLHEGAESR